ncbi:retroviral-like aspartic protease family protein [Rhizosphaericola mali]|uniref:Aspartyl protease n=1 Tax=Rhizosphaericola mali TaxID=2545455 RepID=A0A5P2FZI2_9BACT|nr:aspartyl protease family protein [Rhizosphaericola mali]QES88357.1 hypothetical protein E0W69_006680 [Rhizosphaericola mali]
MILLGLPILGQAQFSNKQERIKEIVQLINQKDAAGLSNLMNENSRLGDFPYPGNNVRFLDAVLFQYPTISEYKIQSENLIGNQNDSIVLSAKYSNGKTTYPSIVFDKNGKIIQLNIIKQPENWDAEKAYQSVWERSKIESTNAISMIRLNGLIYLSAILNGINGYFMLDSGAPFIILNKRFADSSGTTAIKMELRGVGGKSPQPIKSVKNQLIIGNLHLDNLDLPAMNMESNSTWEDSTFFGLIGQAFLNNYASEFDFKNNKLVLHSLEAYSNYHEKKMKDSISFKMVRHIPIIRTIINNQSFNFGLDCGANANVVNNSFVDNIGAQFEFDNKDVAINEVAQTQQKNQTGYIKKMQIGNKILLPQYSVVSDASLGYGLNSKNNEVSGLLGIPFLEQFHFIINYKSKNIQILK